MVTFKYEVPGTGFDKSESVHGVVVWCEVGEAPARPDDGFFLAEDTRSKYVSAFEATDAGGPGWAVDANSHVGAANPMTISPSAQRDWCAMTRKSW